MLSRTLRTKTSNVNSGTANVNLDTNPAYEVQTQLHKNLAYESTTPQAQRNTTEPTYEIISSDINQSANTVAVEMITSEEAGVEGDKGRDTTVS